MKAHINNLQEFIKYSHPYTKGMTFSALILFIIGLVGIICLMKRADATSIQAGLTIVAEILGVLLGTVLIIVVLLIEQGQRAEELLRGSYPKYRRKIETNITTIEKAFKQLIKLIKNQTIQLDEHIILPNDIYLDTKYRDVVGNIIGLIISIRKKPFEYYEKILADLGFIEDEQNEILYGKGALADIDPTHFLKLVEDALDVNCLVQWCSNDVGDLASDFFEEFSHEGVNQAISHFERSRTVLRSKSLVACMVLIMASMALAVVTLFGMTEQALAETNIILLVSAILIGFFISVVLTMLLTQKMFL
jgi:tyrosine-protein phosphatase YwqE